jgi:predicted nucleic acid-binding protein
MYAAGTEHPLREPCQQALRTAVEDDIRLITDAEVLQEILYRYFSIGRSGSARTVHASALDLCDEILPLESTHTTRALELLVEHPRLTPRDAIHVATMEHRGLDLLLSTDQDLDRLSHIERVDPSRFPR